STKAGERGVPLGGCRQLTLLFRSLFLCRGPSAFVARAFPARYNLCMNAQVLRQMMLGRPFQPFEVSMSNGEVHQVRYPDFAFVLRTNFVIGDPDADNVVICSLDQMASVQVPQPVSGETA